MQQDTKGISFDLPHDIYVRLKKQAIDDRTSMKAMIIEAIKKSIKYDGKKRKQEDKD